MGRSYTRLFLSNLKAGWWNYPILSQPNQGRFSTIRITLEEEYESLLYELEPVLHVGVKGEPLSVRDLRLVDVDADDGGVVPRRHVQRDQAAPATRV